MLNYDAIWCWFLASRPADAERNDSITIKVYEQENLKTDSPLVLGLYKRGKDAFIGEYVMYPNGLYKSRHSKGNREWRKVSLAYVVDGGYDYWTSGMRSSNRWRFADGTDVPLVASWVIDNFKGRRFCEYYTPSMINTADDLVRWIGHVETAGNYERKRTAQERKEAAITEWALSLRTFPGDFAEQAARICFGNRHFAFEDRQNGVYELTCCESIVSKGEAKGWKNNKNVTCPHCGAVAKVRKGPVMSERTERARMIVLCRHVDRNGRPCALAVFTTVERHWTVRTAGEWQKHYIDALMPIPMEGVVNHNEIVYGYGDGFSDKNIFHYQWSGSTYAYPDFTPLKNTEYEVRGLDIAAAKGWKINYDGLMWAWRDVPQVEYIIKAGLERLAREAFKFGNRWMSDDILPHKDADKLAEALGIDGQDLARLKALNGGVKCLMWLRDARESRYKLGEDMLNWLCKRGMVPRDIKYFRQLGLSVEQITNYVRKQMDLSGKRCNDVLIDWRDLIEMEKAEKCNMSIPSNVRPKNLEERHREFVDMRNARWEKERMKAAHEEQKRRDAEQAEKERIVNEKHRNVAEACNGIRARMDWSDGEHKAVVPEGAGSIIHEGVLLQHCVASNEVYFDRIVSGESYIVFIRRESAPDTPWFTAEVEPGGKVRQLRTQGNGKGTDEERREAKDFIAKWQRHVRSLMSKEEINQAETSAERYMRELSELIASGTKVRRGVQEGQLLGQVLSDDYNELNEEAQA